MATRQPPGRPLVGREAQRRRTRRALVEATRDLLARGGPAPTVDAIAAAADVSRRTVYVHFPTLDQLLLDAALGALSDAYVDTALESSAGPADRAGADVHARVAALVDAVLDQEEDTLPLGRQIIRLTVDRAPDAGTGGEVGAEAGAADRRPRRGSRRTAWVEAALAPLADRLTAEQWDRLVSGLCLVIGFEAMVVLRDVRGVDTQTEARTTRWAAAALLDAMLTEIGEPS